MNKFIVVMIAIGLMSVTGCRSTVKTAGKAAVRGTVKGAKATAKTTVGAAKATGSAVLGTGRSDRGKNKKAEDKRTRR
jgi:hypothetical protein